MRVSRKDLEAAVEQGVISPSQAAGLWRVLSGRRSGHPRFDVAHIAHYFGALVVVSAVTWFVTLGWERFGGWGLLGISLVYAALFAGAGGFMWRREGGALRVPGGLLVTAAVCMAPLAVYGFEKATNLWLRENPGQYEDFYDWVWGGWFFMEVGTVVAGLVALRFVRFPFLTAPVAFALWFMSMDLASLFYGENYYGAEGYRIFSLIFGIVVIAGSYAVDRRTDEDFAFWGYLSGLLAFWGGLTLLEGGSELGWFVYGAINAGLVLFSGLLRRPVFVVFGALGVFAYVGHLAWEIFEDSLLFPFVLSAVGLAIMALGVLYAKNTGRIERAALAAVPRGAERFLPPQRTAGR